MEESRQVQSIEEMNCVPEQSLLMEAYRDGVISTIFQLGPSMEEDEDELSIFDDVTIDLPNPVPNITIRVFSEYDEVPNTVISPTHFNQNISAPNQINQILKPYCKVINLIHQQLGIKLSK